MYCVRDCRLYHQKNVAGNGDVAFGIKILRFAGLLPELGRVIPAAQVSLPSQQPPAHCVRPGVKP
jgi:hypothetical protein